MNEKVLNKIDFLIRIRKVKILIFIYLFFLSTEENSPFPKLEVQFELHKNLIYVYNCVTSDFVTVNHGVIITVVNTKMLCGR